MKIEILTTEHFDELVKKIDELNQAIKAKTDESLSEKWLTNHEVAKILRVTFRTLLSYRQNGLLPFSQVGSKIYYRISDVQKHLDNHYVNRKRGGS